MCLNERSDPSLLFLVVVTVIPSLPNCYTTFLVDLGFCLFQSEDRAN